MEETPTSPQAEQSTVLLVEDDSSVRRLLARLLDRQGFRVLQASGGREAMTVARTFDGPIHLLVTDVIMPEISGVQLARELTELRPEICVMYISGHPQEIVSSELEVFPAPLVRKPFAISELAREAEKALQCHAERALSTEA